MKIVKTLQTGLALLLLTCAACSTGNAASGGKTVLRLGYFPNITHATAIAGVEKGIFAQSLGSGVTLQTQTFNAGPAAVEALFSGALDASYVGANPAINAFVRSHGAAIRIVSGATSGGAFLVVKPGIDNPGALKGKKLAAPQLGNTQDVALRSWLTSKGLTIKGASGGDVDVIDQDNAQTLDSFRSGDVDGAWVPEPWASRLVLQAGGKVLVDERDLWPHGDYVTTQLVVRTDYLKAHRDVVERLVRGQVEANTFVNEHAAEAKQLVAAAIARLTGKALPSTVIDRAWSNLRFTNDPIAASLRRSADAAHALGLLDSVDLTGIYDLSLLNAILTAQGKAAISTG